jgi:hypothetical protein
MNEMRMLNRIEQFTGTIDELVSWCHQRGLDPAEVKVTGTHLKWQSYETEPEKQRRIEFELRSDARRLEWEAEQYKRLKAKFEGES